MSCGKPCNCVSYRDHLLTVSVSADAMPTRHVVTADINQRERDLAVDMDAYKRLRRDGVQPVRIKGSAAVEKVATERHHVEGGPCN